MLICKTIKSLHKSLQKMGWGRRSLGFVPTMGYFHAGHLSLMRQARKENDLVVVSLFVNPLQFGPREDLAKYPRDLRRDAVLASSVGVDILFVPAAEEMYPQLEQGASLAGLPASCSVVDVPEVSVGLCGASRPGHFRGVATVVAKLLNIVQPEFMYLGQKDAQQVAVLRKMVSDLNFPVKIKVGSIVREPDGLAMSSRNIYLSPVERCEAATLYRALQYAKRMIDHGESDAKRITFEIKKLIVEGTGASIEYISCVNATDLKPVRRIRGEVLIALAVRFRSARLIDNILVASK